MVTVGSSAEALVYRKRPDHSLIEPWWKWAVHSLTESRALCARNELKTLHLEGGGGLREAFQREGGMAVPPCAIALARNAATWRPAPP